MSGISTVIRKFVAHVCSNLMAEVCNTNERIDELSNDIAELKNDVSNKISNLSFSFSDGNLVVALEDGTKCCFIPDGKLPAE